jgi:hypothetical protein
MKKIAALFIAIVTLAINFGMNSAWAQEPALAVAPTAATPSLFINLYELGTVVIPEGGGKTIPLPVATTMGLNLINPITEKIGWSTEVGVGSPNTTLNPAPYVLGGPIFFTSEKLSLNPFAFYQLNPPYSGNGGITTHLLGGGMAIGVVITKEIVFLLPVSTTVSLGGPTHDWSFTAGPGLSFLVF